MGLASLAKRQLPIEVAAACVVAALASGFLLTGLIRLADHGKSIASVRRLFGLLFVSTLIWIIPLSLGVAVSSLTRLSPAGANEFVFGAFLVWGFESVVINAAFLKNTVASLALASIHPLSILLITLYALGSVYLYPALTGILALILILGFLLRLKSLKTKQGVPTLQILQAFLKTWVTQEPGDLEGYFSNYAKSEPVVTDVILAEGKGEEKVAFILPGVHPGPFYPVGSYNLSELIYRALRDKGIAPVVFHGTGGHERNTPTNVLAAAYAGEISRFVSSLSASQRGLMRGPAHDKVGITNITTLAFGEEILAIISNSPFLSDDLDPTAVTEASEVASKLGLRLSMVDAHNSVDGERRPQTPITRGDWESIFRGVLALPEKPFSIGFASSSGMDLKLGPDVSEGGICATLFAVDGSRSVLVSADSNNAVSGLRERIAEELARTGVGFVELCTSDTHNFAARNLTNRGYFALGEGSGAETIVEAVRKLVESAESRVAPCDLAVARFETKIPLIGSESLDDFADLTKNAISISRSYAKALIPVILLLSAITLFY
jgi:putative membrane protein